MKTYGLNLTCITKGLAEMNHEFYIIKDIYGQARRDIYICMVYCYF